MCDYLMKPSLVDSCRTIIEMSLQGTSKAFISHGKAYQGKREISFINSSLHVCVGAYIFLYFCLPVLHIPWFICFGLSFHTHVLLIWFRLSFLHFSVFNNLFHIVHLIHGLLTSFPSYPSHGLSVWFRLSILPLAYRT